MDSTPHVKLPTIAYFSMEIGAEPSVPTYSGGLGVLAGDTLRAATDLGVPMIGMTILYRQGYFKQQLDAEGNQTELPFDWAPEDHLELMEPTVTVSIEGRDVNVRAWRYLLHGPYGNVVPVFFLDTAVEGNSPEDQALTGYLYGGDDRYRLAQETLLGFGGVAILRALGFHNVHVFHMNEGHSALLTLALLKEQLKGRAFAAATESDREAVREHCVFTTHTPVPAGHDQFSMDMVRKILGRDIGSALEAADCCLNGLLNMTYLALRFSRYVNGVAMRHGEISRGMFPNYPIDSITNGVHAVTWTSPPFAQLFDQYIPDWRRDNFYLRHAVCIPLEDVRRAHAEAKRALLVEVERRTGRALDPKALTIGFARRATAYKRPDFIFTDIERLRAIDRNVGPIQILFGGKANPKDGPGKELIRRIFAAAKTLGEAIPVIYLEEYDMGLAKKLCTGVDLWLNTPQKPQEASGTSGMKAALNGVPSLGILDGWWIEGHVEGVTGWSIGDHYGTPPHHASEAESLYSKLEHVVVPLFYRPTDEWARIMRTAITVNGSFFNAQRTVVQYLSNAYIKI